MRLDQTEESRNYEDRRRIGGGTAVAGGGGILAIVLVVVFTLLSGGDVQQAVDVGIRQAQQQAVQANAAGEDAPPSPEEEAQKSFALKVLKLTEDVWTEQLPAGLQRSYQKPVLVFFTGAVQSACGSANSAVGPFYCPGDSKVYLDLTFFNEMQTRFKAPGDFACAYVIAHEVGHHIQNLLGLSMQVQRLQAEVGKVESNQLSVRLELQADFLAGVWAHHAQREFAVLQTGDIDEALRAAQAIGDDTLQRQATGRVVPDAFTHGTSEQRIYWFKKGLTSGRVEDLQATFEIPYAQL
jgi:predicted metalloprotease